MDRATGKFTQHPYDARQPEKLSRPALKKAPYYDHITFITEDSSGAIWIGTAESGLSRYDPVLRRVKHFEKEKDASGTFSEASAWWAYTSREGVLWVSTLMGALYRINPVQGSVPFYPVQSVGVTTIYTDTDNSLWIGTARDGIVRKDASGGTIKIYKHIPGDGNSISSNDICTITSDREGNIWIGTFGAGLNRFDRKTGQFVKVSYDTTKRSGSNWDIILTIYPDPDSADILWLGTLRGLDRLNKKTGRFRHYLFFPNDELEFGPNAIDSIATSKKSAFIT